MPTGTVPTTDAGVAAMIDHALLKPATAVSDIDAGCDLALKLGTASVCVMTCWVERVAKRLGDGPVKTCTVIGFPHGVNTPETKRFESERAIAEGATELDMVVNRSLVKSEDWDGVRRDLLSVIEPAKVAGALTKIIFENAELTDAEKIKLCELSAECGADWVKTSTGFASSGATEDDIALMRRHSPDSMQLKASGGIRTLDQLLRFAELGCSRIGASGSAGLIDAARERFG
ncbi:MAG: deoxyribose-phosphate aldolase [Planctomycetota bacterium]